MTLLYACKNCENAPLAAVLDERTGGRYNNRYFLTVRG